MEEIKEIRQDVKEIKSEVAKQSLHLERYNVLLEQHISRTRQLEDRMSPVESDIQVLNKKAYAGSVIVKAAAWLLGSGILMKLLKLI